MSQAILDVISDKGYPGVITNLHVSNRFVQEDYKDNKVDDDDYFHYSKYMDIYYCVCETTLKLPTWEIGIREYDLNDETFDVADEQIGEFSIIKLYFSGSSENFMNYLCKWDNSTWGWIKDAENSGELLAYE